MCLFFKDFLDFFFFKSVHWYQNQWKKMYFSLGLNNWNGDSFHCLLSSIFLFIYNIFPFYRISV